MSANSGHRERISKNDLKTLIGISKGIGRYPTPSPERVDRLTAAGMIKKGRYGELRPTIKGWLYAMLNK